MNIDEYTLDDLIAVVTTLDEKLSKTHDPKLTEEIGHLMIHMNNIENLGYDINDVLDVVNEVHRNLIDTKSKKS